MPAPAGEAVQPMDSELSVRLFRLTPGRVGGLVSTGVDRTSSRSKTPRVSALESWWTSAAITLSPATSRLPGTVNSYQVVPSAAVTLVLEYVAAVSGPVGRLLRSTSMPLM